MNNFKWIVKERMIKKHIGTMLELSKTTGLGYQTMRNHIDHPENMKLFEFRALDDILQFDDCEKLTLLKEV